VGSKKRFRIYPPRPAERTETEGFKAFLRFGFHLQVQGFDTSRSVYCRNHGLRARLQYMQRAVNLKGKVVCANQQKIRTGEYGGYLETFFQIIAFLLKKHKKYIANTIAQSLSFCYNRIEFDDTVNLVGG